MSAVIDIINVSKKYKKENNENFFALNNISICINRGDSVGIIGSNGAGKSTLLKIISGVTKPSDGIIKINGRVTSLLEVGTGFHSELSGKDNIYLNGILLGINKGRINSLFDQIVQFSGLGQDIIEPVKNYSSGMYMRLAFSVAALLDPDILILDEVLGVGDLEFQEKCFQLVEKLKSKGKTIIFVSHNISTLPKVCTSAVLLEKGRKISQGEVHEIINLYINRLQKNHKNKNCLFENTSLIIDSVSSKQQKNYLVIQFGYSLLKEKKSNIIFRYKIINDYSNVLFIGNSMLVNPELELTIENKYLVCEIEDPPFMSGNYKLDLTVTIDETINDLGIVSEFHFYNNSNIAQPIEKNGVLLKSKWFTANG